MENQRIDKGPADLSEYNVQIAADMRAREVWLWLDDNPYKLEDNAEINLTQPVFPRTAEESQQIDSIVKELKRLSAEPSCLIEASKIVNDRFERGQGDAMVGG